MFEIISISEGVEENSSLIIKIAITDAKKKERMYYTNITDKEWLIL